MATGLGGAVRKVRVKKDPMVRFKSYDGGTLGFVVLM
jgi:hypothetical protein